MIIKKDFFISYTHDDEQWAKWIAETLNDADYSTIIQAWDLKPGTDFVAQIQKALYFVDRFIPVVSKTYLSQTGWAQREWTSIFANAHSSEKNLFIPVCVEQLNAGIDNWGLFSTISTISLFNKSEEELNKELLNGISTNGRSKNTPAIPDTNKKPLFANDMPFNNLPARNTRFTGRTKQLKAISQGFKNRNTILLTQTVKDLDGIGKSEIAKEYAFRKGYEYECIWWINAETDATIQSAYTEFALKKGLVNPDTKEIEIFIEAVKYWMSRHNYWLFIFDNAEDKKLLQKYLPIQNNRCRHILITSRDTLWKSTMTMIDTVAFSPREAIDFLTQYTSLPEDDTCIQLAETLGYLPLALEQAAAYIADVPDMSYADYLAKYNKYHLDILDKYPNAENKAVYTTWKISYEGIKSESARQLLNLCAFFAPYNIPAEWFTKASDCLPQPIQQDAADESRYDEIKAELAGLSLVKIENGKINVHRLVQEAVKESLKEDLSIWVNRCVDIMNKQLYFDFSKAESRSIFIDMIPHLLSVTACPYPEKQEETANLYAFMGYGFNESADYANALEYFRKALEIREKILSDEHPNTATSYNNIGEVYDSLRDYDKSSEYFQKALEIREKILGYEHPDTATSYNNIGGVYDSLGDYIKALKYYKKALVIREKVLEKEHPDTANSYNNIGAIYYNLGDYAKALKFYQKDLEICEKILGNEHPSTAASYNNIGAVYNNQGNYAKTLEYFQKTLNTWKTVFGNEHPVTAATYDNIGLVYKKQRDYGKALECYKKSLDIKERVLDRQHPDTATSYNNIGGVYYNLGDYDKALEYYFRAFIVFLIKLELEHPNTLTVFKNMEITYDKTTPDKSFEEWLMYRMKQV